MRPSTIIPPAGPDQSGPFPSASLVAMGARARAANLWTDETAPALHPPTQANPVASPVRTYPHLERALRALDGTAPPDPRTDRGVVLVWCVVVSALGALAVLAHVLGGAR